MSEANSFLLQLLRLDSLRAVFCACIFRDIATVKIGFVLLLSDFWLASSIVGGGRASPDMWRDQYTCSRIDESISARNEAVVFALCWGRVVFVSRRIYKRLRSSGREDFASRQMYRRQRSSVKVTKRWFVMMRKSSLV